ncbi:hypothetical protein HED60_23875 [Planctomycetales bacterium ZRK34]|nr:hypothetical protein HED60_23875 [Planctomycetales bacterium ZRK34]
MAESIRTPRFDLGRFRRQLALTDIARRYLLVLFITGYFLTLMPGLAESSLPNLIIIGSIFGWLAGMWVSARTAHYVQRLTQMTAAGASLDETESVLGEALGRFTLYRTGRILAYHQFAILRHRQGRFDESSAICSALLAESDAGLAQSLRTTLWIMYAEDRLQLRDLTGVHWAISQLYTCQLSLVETLQLQLLQVRYESACGYDDRLLWNLPRRVELIELMPHGAAALCHHLLADAAARMGHNPLADWLRRRAELLGMPETAEAPVTTEITDPLANPA